jgi:hypothetical protein
MMVTFARTMQKFSKNLKYFVKSFSFQQVIKYKKINVLEKKLLGRIYLGSGLLR